MADPSEKGALPPPSYEDVVKGSSGQDVPQAPYPTAPPQDPSPYPPQQAPYPAQQAPYPAQQAPYPTQQAAGTTPYPYGASPGGYMPVNQQPPPGQYGAPAQVQYGTPISTGQYVAPPPGQPHGAQTTYVHPTVAYNPQSGTVIQGTSTGGILSGTDLASQQRRKKLIVLTIVVICTIVFVIVITNIIF